LIRLGVRVAREQSELVLAELLELAPSGVEEVDVSPEVVEYAVYGAPGELPALPDLEAVAGGALVEIRTQQIADDWPQRWRQFHKPLVIGSKLCVRPPWESPGQAEIDVVIDPGQAFGTGAHPTTRLCLELMLEVRPGDFFVDLGCGSGVLAIVATRLGWPQVLALDRDPTALCATEANARLNGVGVQTRPLDMRREQVPDCDFLAANVLAGPLGAWAASQRRMPPALILSGVLREEADAVRGRFAARGLQERERRVAGDWVALLCTVASWRA
jgi:ribosomal protein L11 methyltransferase